MPSNDMPSAAAQASANPILQARALGQSIWFDDLSRDLLQSGRLAAMVNGDGLSGVTSNPTIFERSIAKGRLYDAAIAALVRQGVSGAEAVCERLMIDDIRDAADVLLPVHRRSDGGDGHVSLEVSPALAYDTAGTVAAARRLAYLVDRPNLMIKVPATAPGIAAIPELIADGINVNATLIFAVEAYQAVAEAYLDGLERALAKGMDLRRLAGVASFFISRIDTKVDARIEELLAGALEPPARERLHGLLGTVAIANARIAYGHFQALLRRPRWHALAARGARPQRLLWASTGTKNPAFSKTYYVEALMGADTVDTMPEQTYLEFRLHGAPRPRLGGQAEAHRTMEALAGAGIPIAAVTSQLLEEGVRLFAEAQERLLATIKQKLEQGAAAAPA